MLARNQFIRIAIAGLWLIGCADNKPQWQAPKEGPKPALLIDDPIGNSPVKRASKIEFYDFVKPKPKQRPCPPGEQICWQVSNIKKIAEYDYGTQKLKLEPGATFEDVLHMLYRSWQKEREAWEDERERLESLVPKCIEPYRPTPPGGREPI